MITILVLCAIIYIALYIVNTVLAIIYKRDSKVMDNERFNLENARAQAEIHLMKEQEIYLNYRKEND